MTQHAHPKRTAKRVHLQGQVQGIGLRPAVQRWAATCNIAGWVANDASGVLIHAEGSLPDIDRFLSELHAALPREAVVSSRVDQVTEPQGHYRFDVQSSIISAPLSTPIPVDTVICDQCLEELLDSEDGRRHAYLFNSCAQCGPRYSIVQSMPFEREQTAMSRYRLCPSCIIEFTDPADRRFHAQTTSCRACGPTIVTTEQVTDNGAAVILEGKILALKGVGGYQLICDATSDDAVTNLRRRKSRSTKPLAVMVRDLAMASALADISGCETALTSRTGPIVLCPAKPGNELSKHINPGLHEVGIVLPTTAWHYLLCETINKPLVVTSGNKEGEPLVYTRQAAVDQISSLCDQMLDHDRDIVRPIDDSVVKIIAGQVATSRLARGLAPHPLPVRITQPLVALGGQQKVSLALSNGHQAILGPHLGDMDTVASQERFVEQYHNLCQLYDTSPSFLIHDQHPDYFTTRWAQQQSIKKMTVQHHHAHVAAAMMEHGWLDQTVLGIAFDGTGYGTDGVIWGGEVLLANINNSKRLAHLRCFPLFGGEQAIRQPHRVALALLEQLYPRQELMELLQRLGVQNHYQSLLPLLDAPDLHVKTTSMGRLFDGVAALLLLLFEAHYEGEPAMLLEACCDRSATGSYPFTCIDLELDWRPMLCAILTDIENDIVPSVIAMRFHRSIAQAIVFMIRSYPQYRAVLTGGCFQNKILVELVRELLDDDTRLGLPGVIPCNDGGLAAGQLVIAAARLNCLTL